VNEAVQTMLSRYDCQSAQDYENALKEIIQEIALLGLWRAKFFEKAAFYGGTALRILYGLDRFSEDLDFSLLAQDSEFKLDSYNVAIVDELKGFGFVVEIENKVKNTDSQIKSAFIKADTLKQFIAIKVSDGVISRTHKNKLIKIKMEVDIDPPGKFQTEAKSLLLPIPFSVLTFKQPDLFAGKLHAVLCRNWGNRTKGRDWYDFVWYVARGIPVRLEHLQERLIQSSDLDKKEGFNEESLKSLLSEKIESLDIKQAQQEVRPFLSDKSVVDAWSKEFFGGLLNKMLVI